jgi:hypothetical protein
MPRPATNREVADEMARAYEKFDRGELIKILVDFTQTYVTKNTMPFNLVGDKGGDASAEKDLDFVKVVTQLKGRLPHIPELNYFQVENGRVTLRAGGQKITFGEKVTAQFDASSSSGPPPAPSAPAVKGVPGAAAAAAAAAKAGGSKAPKEEKANLSETQQEAVNDIVTRFKNLELD